MFAIVLSLLPKGLSTNFHQKISELSHGKFNGNWKLKIRKYFFLTTFLSFAHFFFVIPACAGMIGKMENVMN